MRTRLGARRGESKDEAEPFREVTHACRRQKKSVKREPSTRRGGRKRGRLRGGGAGRRTCREQIAQAAAPATVLSTEEIPGEIAQLGKNAEDGGDGDIPSGGELFQQWITESMPPELMLLDDWPMYSIAGLPDFCSDTVINRQDASDWSILHLVNVQGTVKMSVLALPGDVGQLSESMAAGMRRACSLLSLRVAEWMLCNPSRSAPSVSELNEIMFAAERYVQEHRLFLRQGPLPDLLAIARAHAPGIVIPSVYTLSLEQVDALAGAGETVIVHRDGGDGVAATQLKEVGGSFEHMWTKFIAVPGKVFIAHYIDHFFVLRVDEQYEFWIVDTQGSPSGEGLDRACVLSFGPSTIFSTHELPIATTFYHDMTSADACKLFFRHFVANDCGIRELMKHPQCQPPPSLARQIAFFEVARVGEGDAS